MKSAILDTNVLIAFLEKGLKGTVSVLSQFDEIVVTPTILGEYQAGIDETAKGRKSENALKRFLACGSVRQIAITPTTAIYYAKIFRLLKSAGRPIPTNDMWIAASAIEHALSLCTFDGHFDNIPMLQVVSL